MFENEVNQNEQQENWTEMMCDYEHNRNVVTNIYF